MVTVIIVLASIVIPCGCMWLAARSLEP